MENYKISYCIILCCITILFVGCGPDSHDLKRLNEARTMADSSPGQAFVKLQEIRHFTRLPASCQAEFHFLLTKTMLFTNHPIYSDSSINEAISYYKQVNDSNKLHESFYYKALVKLKISDYAGSRKALLQSNAIAIPLKKTKSLLINYQQLGYNELYLNHPEKAVKYFTLALKHARILNDTSILTNALINLAEVSIQNEKNNEGEDLLKESLSLAEQKNNKRAQRVIINQLSELFEKKMDFAQALAFHEKLRKVDMSRKDIPSWNLAKAILFDKQHMNDSVFHYARIAIQGNDPFVADVAYSMLSDWEKRQGHFVEALGYDQKNDYLLAEFDSNLNFASIHQKYEKEKLENENNQLKIKQKEKNIILLIILLAVFFVSAIIYIYTLQQKKKRTEKDRLVQEELLKNKAFQLEQDNLLLKQTREIGFLREKEALLRESLIRRINLFNKIPSLSNDVKWNENNHNHSQKIMFTDNDWYELKHGIDEVYPDFSTRMLQLFPQLNEEDIHFCCLVKIKVNLQDLSDIYCLSKAAITKKKYRLKKDKLNITDSNLSLDDFLQNF